MEVEEVVVRFRAEGVLNVQKSLYELSKLNRLLAQSFKKTVKSFSEFEKGLKGMNRVLNASTRLMKSVNKQVKNTSETFNNAANSTRKLSSSLMGIGLNMLFTGMAIKRIFDGILQSALTTYDGVIKASSGAVTSTMLLGGAMQYLYFVLGDVINNALEPFVPMLLSLVETIADWIEQNPELTGGLILLGSILGGLAITLGMVTLWISALSGAAGAGGLGAVLSYLGGILVPLLVLIATFGLLWITNFNKIQQGASDLFKQLSLLFQQFKIDSENVGGSLIAIFMKVIIFLANEILNFLNWILSSIIKILGVLNTTIISLMTPIGVGIYNIFANVVNNIKSLFFNAFADIADALIGKFIGTIKAGFAELAAMASMLGLNVGIKIKSVLDSQLSRLSNISKELRNMGSSGLPTLDSKVVTDISLSGYSQAENALIGVLDGVFGGLHTITGTSNVEKTYKGIDNLMGLNFTTPEQNNNQGNTQSVNIESLNLYSNNTQTMTSNDVASDLNALFNKTEETNSIWKTLAEKNGVSNAFGD